MRSAQTVGIRLDYGCAFRGLNPTGQKAPILRYTNEIDFQNGASAVGGVSRHLNPIRERLSCYWPGCSSRLVLSYHRGNAQRSGNGIEAALNGFADKQAAVRGDIEPKDVAHMAER